MALFDNFVELPYTCDSSFVDTYLPIWDVNSDNGDVADLDVELLDSSPPMTLMEKKMDWSICCHLLRQMIQIMVLQIRLIEDGPMWT